MDKSYTQHGEEEYILKYCGDKTDGIYIDIGAGFPRELSNTYFLYEKGWKGLCFEPYPHQAIPLDWTDKRDETWQEYRPKDILLPLALSDHNGEIVMISTGCKDSFIGEIYANQERYKQGPDRVVPCKTMESVLLDYPEFKEPDFVSIDVDSYEHKVFAGMDFNNFKPKLICVEYIVRNNDLRKNWEHLLLPYYEPKEVITGNCFYLRKQ